MKKFFFLICFFSLFLACKKKEENPPQEPEPVKTGSVTIQVQAYDSLGDPLTNADGVRVRLDASNTVTTDPSGKVTFNDKVYGTYLPELFREGWDGPPMAVHLSSPAQTLTIPFAKRSGFRLQNLVIDHIQKDSLTISFNIDKSVPANKVCKVAVITSTSNALTGNAYESADIIELTSTSVSKFNVLRLSKFRNFIIATDSSKFIYVNAIPVSYGEYQTNLLPKPILLGENLFAPKVIPFKKNWK